MLLSDLEDSALWLESKEFCFTTPNLMITETKKLLHWLCFNLLWIISWSTNFLFASYVFSKCLKGQGEVQIWHIEATKFSAFLKKESTYEVAFIWGSSYHLRVLSRSQINF